MNRQRVAMVVASIVLIAPSAGFAETDDFPMVRVTEQTQILETLKAEHPRLILDRGKVEQLRELVETDPLAKKWYAGIRKRANEVLDAKVASYDIPDGRRLLGMSRTVVDRMYLLGLCWQIDRDRKYADRAWLDLQAAARFPDWNPAHFLDTAEMTAAFGIGYDWMFDAWTAARRKTIREALVKHGLKEGMKGYAGGGASRGWWAKGKNNWNQVCNGGLATGALAIADEQPELAAAIVWHACKGLPIAMKHFAPDGGWYEGPGYWGYAMRYNVQVLACLDSALGKDFGLSTMPGFANAGDFYLQMRGASGKSFNYADAGEGHVRHSALLWLASKFDRPALAAYQAKHSIGEVTDLIWYEPTLLDGKAPPLPVAASFRKVEVAAARTRWDDPDALYVGVKVGRNGISHAHLDLGSFVFDALGKRWVTELGADDYNLPDFFGKKRNDYYRIRAEGNNTLVINPSRHQPDQAGDAFCRITRCETVGRTRIIETDLTNAYAEHGAKRVVRTFRLTPSRLAITDQIALDGAGEAWWFAHVRRSNVTVADNGRSATLKQGDQAVNVTLVKPASAKLVKMLAQPLATSPQPAGQNPNNGAKLLNPAPGLNRVIRGDIPQWGKADLRRAIYKLAVHVTDVESTTIEVVFAPVVDD